MCVAILKRNSTVLAISVAFSRGECKKIRNSCFRQIMLYLPLTVYFCHSCDINNEIYGYWLTTYKLTQADELTLLTLLLTSFTHTCATCGLQFWHQFCSLFGEQNCGATLFPLSHMSHCICCHSDNKTMTKAKSTSTEYSEEEVFKVCVLNSSKEV